MSPRGAPPLSVLAHTLAAVGLACEALLLVVALPRHDQLISWSPAFVLFTLSTLVIGWILAWKRPRIALGWILLAIGLLVAMGGPAAAIGVATLRSAPTAAGWMLWYGGQSQWSWIPPIGLLVTQVPLRFPDGRLPSRSWAWFSWYTIGALVLATVLVSTASAEVDPHVPNPAHVRWGDVSPSLSVLLALLLLGTSCIGSVASLFVRYRRADTSQRAQLRWICWAIAIVAGVLVLGWVENLLFGDDSTPGIPGVVARGLDVVSLLTFPLIPIAILVAVLRSGLYAIDRIISRTAAYALVTLSTVIVYAAVVLVLSQLLPELPSVGVAIATLTAAGMFLPLLRVVRRLVDRRFDRARYDAERVADAFGERVRTGTDPHRAGADLLEAVERTLQPSAVGLWTKEGPG